MRGDFLYARLFSCFFKKGYIRLNDGSLFPGLGIFGKYLKGGAVQRLCRIECIVEPLGDGKMGAEQAETFLLGMGRDSNGFFRQTRRLDIRAGGS